MTTRRPVSHQFTIRSRSYSPFWNYVDMMCGSLGYIAVVTHALSAHSSVCDISSVHIHAASFCFPAWLIILTAIAPVASPFYFPFDSSPSFNFLNTLNQVYRMKLICKRNLPLASLIWKSKMLHSPNLFEWPHDATCGKFHSWPHVMGHSQNAGALKIWYKITF